ncbi:MAG: DUF4911 domain-containing protein [Pseudomonadota bacterium]
MQATVRRFRVPLDAIGYVRMIVEAYEGLAVVVSPAAGKSVVEWWIAPGRETEAAQLADALTTEVRLSCIDDGTEHFAEE